MDNNKLHITWDKYLDVLTVLTNIIQNNISIPIDVIVGLTRGGLIPAVYLSHRLEEMPVMPFDPHLLHSSGDPRELINLAITPGITRTILIIDDISDTGKTFDKCVKFFKNRGFNCVTAAVYINKSTTTFVPDFWVKDSERNWIVFPYEKDDKGEK